MIRRKSRKQTQKTEQTVSAAAGQSAGQQTPPMRELSPEERRRRRNKEEIKSFFFRLIILILFLWLMFGVCFGIAPVKNGYMFPRINAGDLMLYYRLERDYNSQDVIVYEADREQRVGRVIAHEGDTVEITGDGELHINDSIVMENNIFYDTYPYEGENVTYPLTLADGEVFVLGDFRQGARDSRYYGAIASGEIKGKVITILRRSEL